MVYRAWSSTPRQIIVLIGAFALIVAFGAVLLCLPYFEFGAKDLGDNPWWVSFMHATCPDYLGETTGWSRVLDFFVTYGGWFVLQGVFVSILVNALDRRGQRTLEGDARCRFKDGHGVVLGWGAMGVSVVEKLAKPGRKVIILSQENAEEVREQLRTEFDCPECAVDPRKVFVFRGSLDSNTDLKALNVAGADEVVVLGDRNVRGNDSRNLQAATRIAELRDARKMEGKVTIHIHIDDLRSYDLIQDIDIPSGRQGVANFHPFNFCEDWARRIWCAIPGGSTAHVYPPLAYAPEVARKESSAYVHLFVLGFGQMGQAIAVQAARIAHYASGRKTKITVVDSKLEAREVSFRSHCAIDAMPDIEFTFLKAYAESATVRDKLAEAADDPNQILSVAVCFSDPDASMSTALSLPAPVITGDNPVYVRQETRSGLSSLAQKIKDQKRWKDIRFFGTLDECYGLVPGQDKIAEQIHNSYIEQAKAEGWYDPEKPSFHPWKSLAEHYRWSNRYQSDAFLERIRAFGYSLQPVSASETISRFPLEQLELLAETEHDRWWAERLLAGWTPGDRNDDLRQHPNLVPYEGLDEPTKEYDRDAIRNMPSLIQDNFGMGLVRGGS